MNEQKLSILQPLFCSRATIVKAQNSLNEKSELDCRLLLQFADGSQVPVLLGRESIESLFQNLLSLFEENIEETFNTPDTEEPTTEEPTQEESQNE